MADYDLLVIGCGPGGQKAAIAAAKLGYNAAVVEKRDVVGGVCVNTGTIPSKSLREAVLYLTGLSQRDLYGQSYRVKQDITMEDLSRRTHHVVAREIEVVRDQLARNRVSLVQGSAQFVDSHTLAVSSARGEQRVSADRVIIATGTRPARPPRVAFDEEHIFDSDGILALHQIPRSMAIVGAGVIGIEYASIFAALGTKVTVIEQRDRMLEFCDDEVVEALQFHLRSLAVTFRFREVVEAVEPHEGGTISQLASGKVVAADVVMYSAGRQGATDGLGLEAVGITPDKRGRVNVDEYFRTHVEHIYAVGDVIGFPALASTSMEQGRLAALHAFGEPTGPIGKTMPIGIYTIPEISYVGRTETELTGASVPYEVGISRYKELARGQICGDSYGMLKLLVSQLDRKLLGVHLFGTGATEIVHIGQAVMGCGGTVDYLMEAVFNYPTLAEAYKVAALDVTNKLRTVERLRS
ncbi:MAG TPA: Si-specific NAD(P)(+) transhydrogenase [Acidimicrobiales bacterium]|nr:Si-specific NAD(P)(+) transhydrogenase [Acidimicrobiales bacterium]